jgi:hypothetical protein
MSRVYAYSNENKMDSNELHKYEIQLLKRIQEQIRIQTEHRREIEEQSQKIKAQRLEIERNRQEIEEYRKKLEQQDKREAEQREAEHIARIKCMSEEDKDRIYKQMIKEREDDKRDYILKYGFEKWEKWQRYKLEHDL